MLLKIKLSILFVCVSISLFAQDQYLKAKSDSTEKVFTADKTYQVKTYNSRFKAKKPKNIILLIGDGMGVAHVFAGFTANKGHLFLDNFKHVGFSKTQSADSYITDSAAGGTAIATGHKTNNGSIGVDTRNKPVKSILEDAEERGLATGLVSTSSITHATPASFISHQAGRSMYEEIAADFLKTDIDVFIGGGIDHFSKRKDGRNLMKELETKGYRVETEMKKIEEISGGKLAGLTAPVHNGRISERGNMLPVATKTAIDILDNNKKGFFLMVEGSQIDWGAHAANTVYVVEEMLDFDQSTGNALEFAAKNKETLIIVTADHETGGLLLSGGNLQNGVIKGTFPLTDHTAVMVPVFAFGPGAEEFTGIMENTDIYFKMKKLLIGK